MCGIFNLVFVTKFKGVDMAENTNREQFKSRFGFIMISAGCAIGLGNVWRFPYICGQYGGAVFILIYILFLAVFALPILVMEIAIGRAAQTGSGQAFNRLEKPGTKWHYHKWACLIGNYTLMIFYTVVTGWFLAYVVYSLQGRFDGQSAESIASIFSDLLADPLQLGIFMLVVVFLGWIICQKGLQKGVERITKFMMVALFAIMAILCINSILLPNAGAGLEFYLKPDFSKLFANGFSSFFDAVYAAMAQAFFTVSVGIGSMLIFGSYIGKEHALTGEATRITVLDTVVAFMAGLIIFPACFNFGIQPDSGPSLVFITLPTVFAQMPLGNLWGCLFFVFMAFAALSTIIAVFESIIAWGMDHWGWSRKKSATINCSIIAILSIPCVLGFNVWSFVQIPGIGDIQAIEDFLVSGNFLPIGSLIILLFCTRKSGWGWDNFIREANTGDGLKYPRILKGYLTYVLPILMAVIIIGGYAPIVSAWFA